jgi:hypothetical protein
LTHWRSDADLRGMLDTVVLDKIAPDESQECRELLSDLDTLLNRAKGLK